MRLVPERIRERREELELSRPEVARRLAAHNRELFWSTSGQQIKRWEEGQRMRGESEVVSALATVLGVSFDFFYEVQGEPIAVGAADDDEEPSAVTVTVPRSLADLLVELAAGIQRANRERERS